ncbi:MAG TPA: MAPEG family protein [Caulobacteraceae bacterium]|nr:MAPEG family protein [Caulobacteraceae bacterium]
MSLELTLLGWTLVLALVQIFLAAAVLNKDFGLKYNIGARDAPAPPASVLGGRLRRAQNNLFETLPLFAAAVLIAHAAGRENAMTRLGAELFLGGRIVYLPLYAAGVPVLRTLAFLVSIVGLILVLGAVLRPG